MRSFGEDLQERKLAALHRMCPICRSEKGINNKICQLKDLVKVVLHFPESQQSLSTNILS